MRFPDTRGGILNCWSNECCVNFLLDLLAGGMKKIPGEEASGAVGLLGDGINVPVSWNLSLLSNVKLRS